MKRRVELDFFEPKQTKAANPAAMAVAPDLVYKMTAGGNRNGAASAADLRPMVHRPGALDAFKLPSLVGGKRQGPRNA